MAANGKANVNGSTNGHQVPMNGSTAGWVPDTRDKIILALHADGGLQRVQETMRQSMAESGVTQSIQEQATALLRSGQAKTMDDVKAIIMKRIEDDRDASATDGGESISIAEEVKLGGADSVRKELRAVAKPNASEDGHPTALHGETTQARQNYSDMLLQKGQTPERREITAQNTLGDLSSMGDLRTPSSGASSSKGHRGLDGSYWSSGRLSRRG